MHLIILPVLYLVHSVIGSAISGYKPLTPEEEERFRNWKETDVQNLWELSGQFEGDIILTPEQQRNGIAETTKRWPNGEIPYMFGEGLSESDKKKVQQSLQDIVYYSCVRPILITEPVEDYVLVQGIVDSCSSVIGRIGGQQILNLGRGCRHKGIILHEFLHAIGFCHQQSAQERDDYVIVHYENIKPESRHNFAKMNTNNFNTIYDYLSLMHYSNKSGSANDEITIETKDPYYQDKIGQAPGLSNTDIIKLNRMYNCVEQE